MAEIRGAYPEGAFYEACQSYTAEGEKKEICKKLGEFWALVDELRKKAEYLPIHKLLWEIYDRTSYDQLVRLQPNGAVRKENLQMLIQKALDFEATSYRGLFNFVRYIENLQKYEVDYGVAESAAGNEDAVRIMSIHKSKGLEFPIVFVSGMSKRFNKSDTREALALHPEAGMGIDAIDPKKRIKLPTLQKKSIQKLVELESLGEELRVLYVALTRPKEKLIMTGALKDARAELEKLMAEDERCVRGRYEGLCAGKSFLDWILMVSSGEETPFVCEAVSIESLVAKKVSKIVQEQYDYEAFIRQKTEAPKELQDKFAFDYPFSKEAELPGKVSVSELKMAAMEEDVREMFEAPQIVPYIPSFLREERKISAAARGTAYHKVMECMDLSNISHSNQVKERIEQLVAEGRFHQTEAEAVNAYEIYKFCQSSLCARMLKAKEDGKLFMEQPFVIAKPANEIYNDADSDQPILIQGIIDAFFEEDGRIVLLDYKTDYIKTEEELIKRYEKQLELYGEAIEQTTGKKVKEHLMYSFCLGKEIALTL
jgi:ATP-dependent helicase/nuclease subunit A